MNNYEKIYWLTRMDSMNNLFVGMIVFSAILLVVYGMGFVISAAEDESEGFTKKFRFWKNVVLTVLIIGALGTTFTPTRNEAILILAGGATMNYVQADTSLSKLPYQTTAFISEYMENAIKELKEEKK